MNREEKRRSLELAEKLISEQNFAAAITVGAVAALLAAAAYGITTAIWSFSYGFAAVAIGIVVGLSMQYLGRGIQLKFAIAAAAYTIAGSVLGNVFRVVMNIALANSTSPIDVFRHHSFSALMARATSYDSFVNIVFWFVAVAAAVFLSKRPLSRSKRLAVGMHRLRG